MSNELKEMLQSVIHEAIQPLNERFDKLEERFDKFEARLDNLKRIRQLRSIYEKQIRRSGCKIGFHF